MRERLPRPRPQRDRLMHKRGLVLAIATTLFLSYFPTIANAQDANPYEGLRALALQFKPGDFGIKTADDMSPYGLIIDMGVARGTATLAAFSSGDASLYLSSGGGIIGGVGHASVREATRKWLHTAEVRLTSFAPATEFPLPATGYVRLSVSHNSRDFDGHRADRGDQCRQAGTFVGVVRRAKVARRPCENCRASLTIEPFTALLPLHVKNGEKLRILSRGDRLALTCAEYAEFPLSRYERDKISGNG